MHLSSIGTRLAVVAAIAAGAIALHARAAIPADAQSPSSAVSRASTATNLIATADARFDLMVLRTALSEAHPSLYRYRSKPEIDAAFDRAFAALDHDVSPLDAYAVFSEAVAAIGDGHTRIVPSKPLAASIAAAKRFPLALFFARGRAFVRTGSGDVARGTEILAIDGTPMPAILASIFRRLPADAGSSAAKFARMQYAFARDYAAFVGSPDRFAVDLALADGTRSHALLDAASPAAAPPASPAPASPAPATTSPNSKQLRLEIVSRKRIAVLTLSTFAEGLIAEGGQRFPAFIDDAFREIRASGTRDLVIDLRGNDGGDAYGPLLYSYLAARPFRVFARAETASRDLGFIRNYSKLDESFLRDFAARLTPAANGRFRARDSAEIPLAPQRARAAYAGHVWILIDGDVFSAAAEFCAVARVNGRARFIGQETGGALAGNASGDFVVLTLPHSGMWLQLPLIEFVTAAPAGTTLTAGGIRPDVPVDPSPEEILRGDDPTMSEALRQIARSR